MKEFLTVLEYTFKENARKKTFIISTVIMIILVAAVISLPAIINKFDTNKSENTSASLIQNANKADFYIIDDKNVLKDNLEILNKEFKGYNFKIENKDKFNALKDAVSSDENKAMIVINQAVNIISFEYYIKNYESNSVPDNIGKAIKSTIIKEVLNQSKVSSDVSELAINDIGYKTNELGKGVTKSVISSYAISMILFLAIYYFAYGVSMSVASEKTSRVMEILVTSTKPSKIVLGKSAAMGLLGLCQLTSIVAVGAITYKLDFPGDFTISGQPLDFSNFTPFLILIIIIYFILGFSLYAMMNAVAGATVSKAEDLGSANMPVTMITMISFYLTSFTLGVPNSIAAVVASIVPFSAAFSMPCRLVSTNVPAWQLALSIVSMLLTIAIISWASIKIYSSAILHYGKRLKLKELFKLSKHNA